MNKKLLELLDKINDQKGTVRNLVDEGKLEDAEKAKKELQDMQKSFDLLKDIEDEGLQNMQNNINNHKATPASTTKDSTKEFANAARRLFKVDNIMKEGTKEDGGYTVPEDIQTKINTYRESKTSLRDLVDVEPVTTKSGQRTFKKRSQQTGFAKVGEGGKIGAKTTPQFERMSYDIQKYAGYFPVTNELLEDSDQNITGTLITWIGDESRVTGNNIILDTIKTKEKTAISGLDDIKKALNVTLGQAFKPTSKIVTNDDGLQYLDTLKDNDGKYLLQPNPANPIELRLCAGATIIPVVVIPNADMPSDVSTAGKRKIPFIIGDLKEGVKFFDRKHLTILASNIAQAGDLNAFDEDLTLFRAIEREDCKVKDNQAFVNGELTLDDTSVVGE